MKGECCAASAAKSQVAVGSIRGGVTIEKLSPGTSRQRQRPPIYGALATHEFAPNFSSVIRHVGHNEHAACTEHREGSGNPALQIRKSPVIVGRIRPDTSIAAQALECPSQQTTMTGRTLGDLPTPAPAVSRIGVTSYGVRHPASRASE